VRIPFRRTERGVARPPGTVEYVGEKRVERVRVAVVSYDAKNYLEKEIASIEECIPDLESNRVTLVHVVGLHDTAILSALGEKLNLHPLVLEDIVNTHQRTKVEDFRSYIYVVLRMILYDETTRRVSGDQISLILGPNYVLLFQETEGDVFAPVRQRIREGRGRSRSMGADYLAYTLIDAVVDHYFTVLEKLGDDIEELEVELIEEPAQKTLQAVHDLKREMVYVRKSVFPVREVVNGLQRAESSLIKKETDLFLRDVYDHTIQLIETLETYRDVVSGLQDLYLSLVSNKMNEVMKVLAIAATIFVPLTFFAGVYGMNFEHMPELAWKWAYPLFWGLMVLLAAGMIVFFRRREWL
jgi:magnesium transporter